MFFYVFLNHNPCDFPPSFPIHSSMQYRQRDEQQFLQKWGWICSTQSLTQAVPVFCRMLPLSPRHMQPPLLHHLPKLSVSLMVFAVTLVDLSPNHSFVLIQQITEVMTMHTFLWRWCVRSRYVGARSHTSAVLVTVRETYSDKMFEFWTRPRTNVCKRRETCTQSHQSLLLW